MLAAYTNVPLDDWTATVFFRDQLALGGGRWHNGIFHASQEKRQGSGESQAILIPLSLTT